MHRFLRQLVAVLAICLGIARGSAQDTNATLYAGSVVSSAILQALYQGKAFEGEFTLDESQESGAATSVPVKLAAKDSKLLCELNLAGSSAVRNESARRMLQVIGIDRVGVLHVLGQPTYTLYFPSSKSAVDLPMPDEIAKELKHYRDVGARIRKAGSELVEGVEFRKVLIPDSANSLGIGWLQSDRNDFPALLEGFNPSKKEKFLLRTVSLFRTEPSDDRFTIPAGYKRYGSLQEMQQVTARRLGLPSGRPR